MSGLSIKTAKLASVLGAVTAIQASSHSGIETWLLGVGFVSAVLVWVALQVRDYKPNRRLRADNSELRAENDDQLRRLGESETRIKELEKSRDFEKSFAVVMTEVTDARIQAAAEHRAILEAITEQRKHQNEAWATFHQQLASLTSAIQVVASGILSDAREVKHEATAS